MPRRSVIRETLARPGRCRTPLLRPPSTYSPTSISTSRPVHSANAPSVRSPTGWLPGVEASATRNWKVRASRSTTRVHLPGHEGRLDLALGLHGDPDHDELEGLGGCNADLGDQLS